ncbi:unnamed protein product [Orchesella dallaii]|uniref:UEV domain-containing protein n=1 Tax=Orchesella dallaii TaxID=48710 RepID=A0ABP1RWF4_9HEXA
MTTTTEQEVLERTLAQLNYKKVSGTASAILEVTEKYNNLKHEPNYFSFNNGIQKQLMTLTGTVPIIYKGTSHNIPMVVWVPTAFPADAPTVFVKPTEKLPIQKNQSYYILSDGFISLSSLFSFKIFIGTGSTILNVIDGLTAAFNKDPPVQFIDTVEGEKGLESPTQSCVQMPYDVPINKEDLVKTLISYQYNSVEQYADAILEVTCKFSLKPVLDNYVFNNGTQETLLTLTGTLPVRDEVNGNVPIVIWFPNSRNQPDRIKVFVKPTQEIKIICGDFDYTSNGEVVGGPCMPLMRHARLMPQTFLVNLITGLIEMFCKCCPVHFKSFDKSGSKSDSSGVPGCSRSLEKQTFLKRMRAKTAERSKLFPATKLRKAITSGSDPVQKTMTSEPVVPATAATSGEKGNGFAKNADVVAIPAAAGGLPEDDDSGSDSSGSFESVEDFIIEAGGVPEGVHSNAHSGSVERTSSVEHEVHEDAIDFIAEESLETGSGSESTSTEFTARNVGTNKVKLSSESESNDVTANVPVPQPEMRVEACTSHGSETDNCKMVLRSGKKAAQQNFTVKNRLKNE